MHYDAFLDFCADLGLSDPVYTWVKHIINRGLRVECVGGRIAVSDWRGRTVMDLLPGADATSRPWSETVAGYLP